MKEQGLSVLKERICSIETLSLPGGFVQQIAFGIRFTSLRTQSLSFMLLTGKILKLNFLYHRIKKCQHVFLCHFASQGLDILFISGILAKCRDWARSQPFSY